MGYKKLFSFYYFIHFSVNLKQTKKTEVKYNLFKRKEEGKREGKKRQDGGLQQGGDEYCSAAAVDDGGSQVEPAKHEGEYYLQHQSQNEVGDGVDADGNAFEDLGGELVLAEACKQADEVTDAPCDNGGYQGKTYGERQVSHDDITGGRREVHKRGTEIKVQQTVPQIGGVLLPEGTFQTELDAQGLAQRFLRRRIHGAGTGFHLTDHGFNGVRGEHAGNEEDECYTDEDRQRPGDKAET